MKIFFRRVQAEKFVEDEFYVPEGRRHRSGWFQRRGGLPSPAATEFVAEGIQDDPAFRQAALESETVFSRSPGVGRYTYTMRPNIAMLPGNASRTPRGTEDAPDPAANASTAATKADATPRPRAAGSTARRSR